MDPFSLIARDSRRGEGQTSKAKYSHPATGRTAEEIRAGARDKNVFFGNLIGTTAHAENLRKGRVEIRKDIRLKQHELFLQKRKERKELNKALKKEQEKIWRYYRVPEFEQRNDPRLEKHKKKAEQKYNLTKKVMERSFEERRRQAQYSLRKEAKTMRKSYRKSLGAQYRQAGLLGI